MNELSETQKAYLAATIDCDGCIHINKAPGKKCPIYSLKVKIGQCNRDFLEYWQKKTGVGFVSLSARAGEHTYKKDYFQWQIYSSAAIDLLKEIEPYIFSKRAQALIAIEFEEIIPRFRYKPKPKEVLAKWEKARCKLKALKRAQP